MRMPKDFMKKYEKHQLWLDGKSDGKRLCLLRADLSYADLSNANLSHADLSYADLSYANLYKINLGHADLSHASLPYANLSYAHLFHADLNYANLSYANLNYANLDYADLNYANLDYADLNYVKLDYADLFGATGPFFTAQLGRHNVWATCTHIGIGCIMHTHEWWQNNYQEVGRRLGYSQKEIERYFTFIQLAKGLTKES